MVCLEKEGGRRLEVHVAAQCCSIIGHCLFLLTLQGPDNTAPLHFTTNTANTQLWVTEYLYLCVSNEFLINNLFF